MIPSTYSLDLQYMFGKELLVAPIYNSSGERTIYLPAGRWIDFWTHEILEGSRTIKVQVPLDIMPLYVRANALIPTIEPPQFTTEAPFEEITFDAYLLEQGAFELRDTDGMTRIYRNAGRRPSYILRQKVQNNLWRYACFL